MKEDPFAKMRQKLRESSSQIPEIEEDDELECDIDEEDVVPPKIEEPKVEDKKDLQGYHVFFPRADITAYDIARILSLTEMLIPDELYEKYPPDLQKFFVKFNEIKQETSPA